MRIGYLDTADLSVGNALTSDTSTTTGALSTARSISMTGDVTWSVNFDGTADVTAIGTLGNGPYAPLVAAPATAASAGTAGQIAYDASYFYVCIASGTWVRAALASW